jgi:DNA-binding Lrp family transcriptional regulator
MNLDAIERKLLARLQNGFPLTAEPFVEMGKTLGLPGDEVIRRIRRLKELGVIRLIGPVFDARSLGYLTTLVAAHVPEEALDRCSGVINRSPRISHAYVRDHSLNLWFTLAAHGPAGIDEEMRRIAKAIPAETIFQLPALKLYKIGAFFGADGESAAAGDFPLAAELSPGERAVINGLQRDLPLEARPFTEMSGGGMGEERFLGICRSLLERGIMRRYGAAVNHRQAGYTANAMVCWEVPSEKTDEAGRRLASRREVSHCYERKTNPAWPYNLFAMIHGQAREACLEVAAAASREGSLGDFLALFSSRELKKTRIKYPV